MSNYFYNGNKIHNVQKCCKSMFIVAYKFKRVCPCSTFIINTCSFSAAGPGERPQCIQGMPIHARPLKSGMFFSVSSEMIPTLRDLAFSRDLLSITLGYM